MPNWCSCQLEVSGDRKEMERLFKLSDSTKISLSLEKLYPQPEDIGEGWYDWRVNNWGTKWDLNDVNIEDQGECFTVNFETAWGPPLEAFEKISKDFPSLSFELSYQEPGMDFCGKATYENGIDENYSESYQSQFGLTIEYDKSQAKIENEQIIVPVTITRKTDPYEFGSDAITSKCILTIPKDTDEDEIYDLFDDTILLTSEDEISDILDEKKDEFTNDLYDSFDEIKKVAEYNTLNNEVPEKPATRSKYKL